jgi:hypothetical protein
MKDEQNTNACLMEARLTFRQLLSGHGLVKLAGGHEDAISWLEAKVIELADSVSRRQRFRELLQQTREVLRGGQQRCVEPPGAETKGRLNPYVEARFRRIKI